MYSTDVPVPVHTVEMLCFAIFDMCCTLCIDNVLGVLNACADIVHEHVRGDIMHDEDARPNIRLRER